MLLGYRRRSPPRRPKLDPYRGGIDRILEEDRSLPKKQRHTAKRIYERPRAGRCPGDKSGRSSSEKKPTPVVSGLRGSGPVWLADRRSEIVLEQPFTRG